MFLLGHFSLVDEATFVGRVPVSRRRGELRPSTVSRTGLWRWCIWNFEISMWENLVHIHISSYNIIYPSYMIWWYTLKIHRIHGDPREIFCEKIVSKKPPDSKRCSVWFLQRRVTVIFLAQDPPPMTVEEKRQAAKLEAANGSTYPYLTAFCDRGCILKLGPFLSNKLLFPTGTRFCVCGLLSYRLPDLWATSCDFSVSSSMCVCVLCIYTYIHTYIHTHTIYVIINNYIIIYNYI